MSIRLDETGFGKVKIYQNPEAFCYGVDAVLLAGFAAEGINRQRQMRIMDLGTGTGIVPLILSHKTDAAYIAGVELQQSSFELAQKNVKCNGLEHRLEFFHGDVKDFAHSGLVGTFDVVTSNPPYTAGKGGIESKNQAKAIARQEISATLDDFIRVAAKLLTDGGDFYMVHRPTRLVDICESCRKHRLEPKELVFVSGKPLERPNIILIHCCKNGNPQLKILEPVFVHEEDGGYSEKILNLYEKIKK